MRTTAQGGKVKVGLVQFHVEFSIGIHLELAPACGLKYHSSTPAWLKNELGQRPIESFIPDNERPDGLFIVIL